MAVTPTTPRHEELRLAFLGSVKGFDDIPPIEQLAIMAYTVGQYIAMQDKTKYSPNAVQRIVVNNMEMGNAQVIASVMAGETVIIPNPEPPWPIGAPNAGNAKRAGWYGFFEGRARDKSGFPPLRRDLIEGFAIGWDAAKAWKKEH